MSEPRCTCDFDKWQPEPDTGHAWTCEKGRAMKGLAPLADNRTPEQRLYDAWATSPSRYMDDDEQEESDA